MQLIHKKQILSGATALVLSLSLAACGHHSDSNGPVTGATASNASGSGDTGAGTSAGVNAGVSVAASSTPATTTTPTNPTNPTNPTSPTNPGSVTNGGVLQTASTGGGYVVGTVLHATGSTLGGTSNLLNTVTSNVPVVNGVVQTATAVTTPLSTSLANTGSAITTGGLAATPVVGTAVGSAVTVLDNTLNPLAKVSLLNKTLLGSNDPNSAQLLSANVLSTAAPVNSVVGAGVLAGGKPLTVALSGGNAATVVKGNNGNAPLTPVVNTLVKTVGAIVPTVSPTALAGGAGATGSVGATVTAATGATATTPLTGLLQTVTTTLGGSASTGATGTGLLGGLLRK